MSHPQLPLSQVLFPYSYFCCSRIALMLIYTILCFLNSCLFSNSISLPQVSLPTLASLGNTSCQTFFVIILSSLLCDPLVSSVLDNVKPRLKVIILLTFHMGAAEYHWGWDWCHD